MNPQITEEQRKAAEAVLTVPCGYCKGDGFTANPKACRTCGLEPCVDRKLRRPCTEAEPSRCHGHPASKSNLEEPREMNDVDKAVIILARIAETNQITVDIRRTATVLLEQKRQQDASDYVQSLLEKIERLKYRLSAQDDRHKSEVLEARRVLLNVENCKCADWTCTGICPGMLKAFNAKIKEVVSRNP